MKFVDQVKIQAKAGDGGNGCCSFRREKFVPRGGPDGGNGGRGGDIILEADIHTDHLISLYYEPIVRSEKGEHGQGKGKHGRCAKNTYVKVPLGTLIYQIQDSNEVEVSQVDPEEDIEQAAAQTKYPLQKKLIKDLSHAGEQFMLCEGGAGGKGNKHFKSSINRAPRRFTLGKEGEYGTFWLELRTIAFAGLVGYPNAGKSTLLTSLSAAHPKIAPYPFTTLHPSVGVVDIDDDRQVTVADIPGLIKGAHQNKGLGHEFLRHILRCSFLIFVIDMAGSEGRDPWQDFQTLQEELVLYNPDLLKKAWCVIANKMDLPEADENRKLFEKKLDSQAPLLPVIAQIGKGLEALKTLFASQDQIR